MHSGKVRHTPRPSTGIRTPDAAQGFLSRLKLSDFRNYAAVSLELDERHVVLTGDNGAGKTNLMEAVSFLSPGRGLRRAAYADVARVGADRRLFDLCRA